MFYSNIADENLMLETSEQHTEICNISMIGNCVFVSSVTVFSIVNFRECLGFFYWTIIT